MEGQYVDVSSNSKGKGFAGGMKRHNFQVIGLLMEFPFLIDLMVLPVNVKIQEKYLKVKRWPVDLVMLKKLVQNLKFLKIDTKMIFNCKGCSSWS